MLNDNCIMVGFKSAYPKESWATAQTSRYADDRVSLETAISPRVDKELKG